MKSSGLDVIVIGAGHAGLSVSYHLKKNNLRHLVFEKGLIAETWRNQRWDTFRLNTPNKFNLLPGEDNIMPDGEGYGSASDYASYLEAYSSKFQLPVFENCRVVSVERLKESKGFAVHVKDNGSMAYYRCQQIIVASGAQNIKQIPPFAGNVSPGIYQLHAGEYRNVELLPPGAVLVAGSAQSGMQIAEDLIAGGRKVYISTSKVGRVPRRYRGRDIVDWFDLTGINDALTSEITDPQILQARQPQVSGVGKRGHTVSLQSLARADSVILGRLTGADSANIVLEPNAAANVHFADEFSKNIKKQIDDYIVRSQCEAPPPEEDIADLPDEKAACASDVPFLSLKNRNITSIIWATGFKGDFSYLKLPVSDGSGTLRHSDGLSSVEGLYFVGLPWLRKRKSGIIPGIREDSEFIVHKLMARR
jgi:putative flavoprotein involved in K+ transport